VKPAILDRLRGVQPSGDGWLAFCPAHPDRTTRSLSVSITPDGKTLLHCFVGCAVEKIVAAVDMSLADLMASRTAAASRSPLTLEAFAAAKQLPVDFLREMGVEQHRDGLRITYGLADGSLATRQRLRTALVAREGSRWLGPMRESPVAYGLWRLEDAREKGELTAVEGETNTLTAWYHNIPCLGIPGADLVKVVTAEALIGIETLWILKDPDKGGDTFVAGFTTRLPELGWHGRAMVVTLPTKDLNDLHRQAGDDFAQRLQEAQERAVPLTAMPKFGATAEPELRLEGLDLALLWPGGVRFTLTAIRDGREGVRGELTVTRESRRLSWGAFALASTQAREGLRRKLEHVEPGLPWGEYLEETAFRLSQAAREGDPIVTLTGSATSRTRELLPGLLYEGEPTLIYADGDTGKSLVALTLAAAVHGGAALPLGLRPASSAPAAYLDWETSQDTLETRLALIAAGLGIEPPQIFYKRMKRPLVDEAATLAAEFARRRIGFIVIDSMMFAMARVDGAAFHEPITAFYNSLRLFAPAASLVLSHVTNEDARVGRLARPFGGAFAFNGPRLIWEAKRDREITDATAIVFTCRKANNLARLPEPFGLRFVPGDGTITIYPFDLKDAAPQATVGASLTYRIRLAIARGIRKPDTIAKELNAKRDTVDRTLRRLRTEGKARETHDGWELVS
jgi:hypothetical protein